MSLWKGQSSEIYKLPQVKEYLSLSSGGETAYMWAAEYSDGTIITQFPGPLFDGFQEDPEKVPSVQLGLSVSKLDVSKVKEFVLIPTAHARKYLPWLTVVRMPIRLDKDEKFISYRLRDNSTVIRSKDGEVVGTSQVCRFVVGISQYANGAQTKTFVVLSPSGLVTVTSTDDLSYEGEG